MAQSNFKKFQCVECKETVFIPIKSDAKAACPECQTVYSLDSVEGKYKVKKVHIADSKRNNSNFTSSKKSKQIKNNLKRKRSRTLSKRQNSGGSGILLTLLTLACLIPFGIVVNKVLNLKLAEAQNLTEVKLESSTLQEKENQVKTITETNSIDHHSINQEKTLTPDIQLEQIEQLKISEPLQEESIALATTNLPTPSSLIEKQDTIKEENQNVLDSRTNELEIATVKEIVHRDISFLRDIRPILENKCVNCHGAERQKG